MPDRVRRALEVFFNRVWYQGDWRGWLLLPLSLLFALLTWLIRLRWRLWPPAALPVPVVVIGGITVGGTGKTPVIATLARRLAGHGLAVAVVSRGYGGSYRGVAAVTPDSAAAVVGDEPVLIARDSGVPVYVARDRRLAVAMAAARGAALVLSDDGLQHYAMPRDYEVVVLDEQRGLGNEWLLPAGPLREGRWRLDRVDWVLARNGGQPDTAFWYRVTGLRHLCAGTRIDADTAAHDWADATVSAATGLGQPQQFFELLGSLGIGADNHAFADHHALTAAEIAALPGDRIVVTAKDAVKLVAPVDPRIWVLEIEAVIPDGLVASLCTHFGGRCG